MGFTLHNSYISLELVSSTVIFGKSLLLTQKLLKQVYVAPRLKSSLHKFTVVITIWLTATKYPYLKGRWIFTFYVDVLFPLSLPRLLPDFTAHMRNTVAVL